MEIFIASRLSNGNILFPTEIRIDDKEVTIVKPGPLSLDEKSIEYNKLTSVQVFSPMIGFSKLIITAYELDSIVIEGLERRDAEEAKRLILKNMRRNNGNLYHVA